MKELAEIALGEFADIVVSAEVQPDGKLRIYFTDTSYLDIWFSENRPGICAYHWERKHVDGSIHRHDNIPHKKLELVSAFPKHYHAGGETNVIESTLPDERDEALRQFLTFCRTVITPATNR